MAKAHSDYFEWDDDTESYKQLKLLPDAWVYPSRRFKVGDKIEMLESQRISMPGNAPSRDLKGEIGTVVSIRDGRADGFPSRVLHFVQEDGGSFYSSQSEGWLVVRFPFDCYGFEADGKTYKPRACHLSDEGKRWKKATGKGK